MAEDQLFEIRTIGEGIFLSGLLALALGNEEEPAAAGGQMLPFYQDIIKTVFKDMDIQKSLEDGIIKEEQHRIASEIHDTVIQKLFGISCGLNVLENTVETLSEDEIKDRVKSIEISVGLTMKELREAIYGIRFESESGGSFEEKLRLYLQEVERLGSVSICLDSAGDFSLLSAAQKTVVYRIVCEAVGNAVRHGSASHLDASVTMSETGIGIWVGDNGSGFEPDLDSAKGTGMKNMHRMASLMKGTCSIRPGAEKGTEVDVFLPW
jgi:signal transduction histidine kinase